MTHFLRTSSNAPLFMTHFMSLKKFNSYNDTSFYDSYLSVLKTFNDLQTTSLNLIIVLVTSYEYYYSLLEKCIAALLDGHPEHLG